jgi:hypothetical protein
MEKSTGRGGEESARGMKRENLGYKQVASQPLYRHELAPSAILPWYLELAAAPSKVHSSCDQSRFAI